MAWQVVARLADLPDGQPVRAEAGDYLLVLVRQGATVRAADGLCPHKFGDLSHGTLLPDGRLRCPVHAASFDLATGASDQAFAPPLRVYPTRVAGGAVEADL